MRKHDTAARGSEVMARNQKTQDHEVNCAKTPPIIKPSTGKALD
jgi:hypothetical protein